MRNSGSCHNNFCIDINGIKSYAQCSIYQTMSNFVYLALPKYICDVIQNMKIFKNRKIGLLVFYARAG